MILRSTLFVLLLFFLSVDAISLQCSVNGDCLSGFGVCRDGYCQGFASDENGVNVEQCVEGYLCIFPADKLPVVNMNSNFRVRLQPPYTVCGAIEKLKSTDTFFGTTEWPCSTSLSNEYGCALELGIPFRLSKNNPVEGGQLCGCPDADVNGDGIVCNAKEDFFVPIATVTVQGCLNNSHCMQSSFAYCVEGQCASYDVAAISTGTMLLQCLEKSDCTVSAVASAYIPELFKILPVEATMTCSTAALDPNYVETNSLPCIFDMDADGTCDINLGVYGSSGYRRLCGCAGADWGGDGIACNQIEDFAQDIGVLTIGDCTTSADCTNGQICFQGMCGRDIYPPYVDVMSPPHDSYAVPPVSQIKLQFSESIQKNTASSAGRILISPLTNLTAPSYTINISNPSKSSTLVVASGDTLTVTPDVALIASNLGLALGIWQVTIEANVVFDLSNNANSAQTLVFGVSPDGGCPFLYVTGFFPGSTTTTALNPNGLYKASNTPLNNKPRFSGAVTNTLGLYIYFQPDSGSIAKSWLLDTDTNNIEYVGFVPPAVMNAQSAAQLQLPPKNSTWNYWVSSGWLENDAWMTCKDTLDATQPSLIDVFPAPGAVGVEQEVKILLTFNEEVTFGHGGAVYLEGRASGHKLTFRGDIAAGQRRKYIQGAGTKTITLIPYEALYFGETYDLYSDSGSFTDLAYNPWGKVEKKVLFFTMYGSPCLTSFVIDDSLYEYSLKAGDEGDSHLSTRNVRCKTGYSPKFATVEVAPYICTDGKWDPPTNSLACAPNCPVYLIDASSSYTITQGSNNVVQGSQVTISCKAGTASTGGTSPSSVTCQGTGAWSSLALKCGDECGPYTPITGITIKSATGSTLIGATRTLSCSSDYYPVSSVTSETISCLSSSREWSAITALSCQKTCSTFPVSADLRTAVTPQQSTTASRLPGSSHLITCKAGTSIPTANWQSSAMVTCHDGIWSPTPAACVDSCPPYNPGKGYVFSSADGGLAIGAEIIISCEVDAKRTSGPISDSIVCVNSAWTLKSIVCDAACEIPTDFYGDAFAFDEANSIATPNVRTGKYPSGSQVSLRCSANASVSRGSQGELVTCSRGEWSSVVLGTSQTLLKCSSACEIPQSSLSPGVVLKYPSLAIEPGVEVTSFCANGWSSRNSSVASTKLVCQENGEWSGPMITCSTTDGNLMKCYNGVRDPNEDGVDCGGVCSVSCTSCGNGIKDGDEEGVDCGGSCFSACKRCDPWPFKRLNPNIYQVRSITLFRNLAGAYRVGCSNNTSSAVADFTCDTGTAEWNPPLSSTSLPSCANYSSLSFASARSLLTPSRFAAFEWPSDLIGPESPPPLDCTASQVLREQGCCALRRQVYAAISAGGSSCFSALFNGTDVGVERFCAVDCVGRALKILTSAKTSGVGCRERREVSDLTDFLSYVCATRPDGGRCMRDGKMGRELLNPSQLYLNAASGGLSTARAICESHGCVRSTAAWMDALDELLATAAGYEEITETRRRRMRRRRLAIVVGGDEEKQTYGEESDESSGNTITDDGNFASNSSQAITSISQLNFSSVRMPARLLMREFDAICSPSPISGKEGDCISEALEALVYPSDGQQILESNVSMDKLQSWCGSSSSGCVPLVASRLGAAFKEGRQQSASLRLEGSTFRLLGEYMCKSSSTLGMCGASLFPSHAARSPPPRRISLDKVFSLASTSLAGCPASCPSVFLGDGICDDACFKAECGFDLGDCALKSRWPLLARSISAISVHDDWSDGSTSLLPTGTACSPFTPSLTSHSCTAVLANSTVSSGTTCKLRLSSSINSNGCCTGVAAEALRLLTDFDIQIVDRMTAESIQILGSDSEDAQRLLAVRSYQDAWDTTRSLSVVENICEVSMDSMCSRGITPEGLHVFIKFSNVDFASISSVAVDAAAGNANSIANLTAWKVMDTVASHLGVAPLSAGYTSIARQGSFIIEGLLIAASSKLPIINSAKSPLSPLYAAVSRSFMLEHPSIFASARLETLTARSVFAPSQAIQSASGSNSPKNKPTKRSRGVESLGWALPFSGCSSDMGLAMDKKVLLEDGSNPYVIVNVVGLQDHGAVRKVSCAEGWYRVGDGGDQTVTCQNGLWMALSEAAPLIECRRPCSLDDLTIDEAEMSKTSSIVKNVNSVPAETMEVIDWASIVSVKHDQAILLRSAGRMTIANGKAICSDAIWKIEAPYADCSETALRKIVRNEQVQVTVSSPQMPPAASIVSEKIDLGETIGKLWCFDEAAEANSEGVTCNKRGRGWAIEGARTCITKNNSHIAVILICIFIPLLVICGIIVCWWLMKRKQEILLQIDKEYENKGYNQDAIKGRNKESNSPSLYVASTIKQFPASPMKVQHYSIDGHDNNNNRNRNTYHYSNCEEDAIIRKVGSFNDRNRKSDLLIESNSMLDASYLMKESHTSGYSYSDSSYSPNNNGRRNNHDNGSDLYSANKMNIDRVIHQNYPSWSSKVNSNLSSVGISHSSQFTSSSIYKSSKYEYKQNRKDSFRNEKEESKHSSSYYSSSFGYKGSTENSKSRYPISSLLQIANSSFITDSHRTIEATQQLPGRFNRYERRQDSSENIFETSQYGWNRPVAPKEEVDTPSAHAHERGGETTRRRRHNPNVD